MLPVLRATSSANWDPQAPEAEMAVSQTKMPHPATSAGVIPGLANLTEKQEDPEGIKDKVLPCSSGRVPWQGCCKKPKVHLEGKETSQGCKVEKENKAQPGFWRLSLVFRERKK